MSGFQIHVDSSWSPQASFAELDAQTELARAQVVRYRKSLGERMFSHMLGPVSYSYGYGLPGSWSGDRIEMVLHYRHWVFVAVRAIAHEISGLLPNIALVHPGKHPAPQYHGLDLMRRKRWLATNKNIQPHEEIDPLPEQHPLSRLLRRPNPVDTWSDLIYELVLFWCLTGDAYLWAVPNRAGGVSELWVIPSHWIFRFGKNPNSGHMVDYYDITPWVGGAGAFQFPADEVIRLVDKSPVHKISGYSTQTALAEDIDVDESIRRSRFFQMKNGAFPLGALETDAAGFHDPNDAEIERIYAKFTARYQGEANSGRPIILPPGAKYNPLTIAPDKMMWVESSDQLRDIILAGFGVPKEVAGIQDAGSEIAMYGPIQQFHRNCVTPRTRQLSNMLTYGLAHRYDQQIRMWYDDSTPESPQQINADLQLDLSTGVRTINEARALRGLPPYKNGGDDPIMPMGSAPMPLNTGEDLSGLDFSSLPGGNAAPPPPMAGKHVAKQITNPQPPPQGLLEVPDIRQPDPWSCGAAAAMAVGRWFKVGPESLDEWKTSLNTNEEHSTSPQHIIGFLKALGLSVEAKSDMTIADLDACWRTGSPVICPCQDYMEQRPAKAEWDYGHYLTFIGRGFQYCFFQDSSEDNATEGSGTDAAPGRVMIEEARWLDLWHDVGIDGQEYVHYGIIVGPPQAETSVSRVWERNGHVALETVLAGVAEKAASFEESKHPRDDSGKFGEGSGGGGGSSDKEPSDDSKDTGKKASVDYSDAEKQALSAYSGGIAFRINAALREGAPLTGKLAEVHQNLQSAFDKTPPLDEPRTVYRGLSLSTENAEAFVANLAAKMEDAELATDRGYASTTKNQGDVADSPVSLEIKAKHGIELGELANNQEEGEFLLNAGSRFHVISIEEKEGGGWHVQLEQVLPKKKTKSFEESKHPRGQAGQFGSGGHSAAQNSAGHAASLDRDRIPVSTGKALAQAPAAAKGILAKLKDLPKAAIKAGVSKAKELYQKCEAKYGKAWARAIVAVGVVTLPTPFTTGSVLATMGLAHVCTKLFGRKSEEQIDLDVAFQRAVKLYRLLCQGLDDVELSEEDQEQVQACLEGWE